MRRLAAPPTFMIPYVGRIICKFLARTGAAMKGSRIYYEGSQPILRVENMEAALRFYVDVLGFSNAHWGTDEFTSVNRDQAGIYLCCGGQGRGAAWVWLGVDDV